MDLHRLVVSGYRCCIYPGDEYSALHCCVLCMFEQIVSVKEIRRILSNAEVQQLPLPELRSCSKILEHHHIRQVRLELLHLSSTQVSQ